MNALPKKEFFGIGITDATQQQILEYTFSSLSVGPGRSYIVTPNPEIIMFAQQNAELKRALNEAEIAICDGIGLYHAARFLGKPLPERVTGVDMVDAICREAVLLSRNSSKKPVSVGFLGAGKGVALRTAECLQQKYPGLHVVFAAAEWSQHGFVVAKDENQESRIKNQERNESEMLNTKSLIHNTDAIDILFVAFGFPKQEFFMSRNREKIPVKVMMGVGGAFDYLSGGVVRAPTIIRSLGLEWLYRLVRQPWRAQRQFALIKFIGLVMKEKLRHLKA